MLSDISPAAQQRIARAVNESLFVQDRYILCHTPAVLEPVDECIEAKKHITVILPRPGLIQRIVRQHEREVFTFQAVFSASVSAGPIEACVDLLLKASQWYPNVCRVRKALNLERVSLAISL